MKMFVFIGIFDFHFFPSLLLLLLLVNITNATRIPRASTKLCVCLLFFADFRFYSLSNVNDAARLLRNVKQAEGNILYLLPFAFHAYLIKNDFFSRHFQCTPRVMLSFSFSLSLFDDGSLTIAIPIAVVIIVVNAVLNVCRFAVKPK